MTERTFGIKARSGPDGPFICFGQIKRDPVTLRSMLHAIEGLSSAVAIVDDDELYSALERLLVVAPKQEGTSLCGPMFWPFKEALERAIKSIS